MFDSLWPHGLQHSRLLCPSLSPGVWPNSCPLSWWCYLTISSPATTFPFAFHLSQHQNLFQWVSSLHQPKVRSFSFSINPSSECLGLISIRIYWFDLLAIQVTLKSLLQHHNLKASSFRHSAFFMVQRSNPSMTIALTILTFVGIVMSLLFNMLSRFVIAFIPRRKHLLISAVTICSDSGAPRNKICHCFHYFPFYLPWSDGTVCPYLSFFV